MSGYTYRKIITKEDEPTIVKVVYVPDEVVNQIKSDAIDEFLAKVKEKYPTAKNALYYLTRIADELKEGGKNE